MAKTNPNPNSVEERKTKSGKPVRVRKKIKTQKFCYQVYGAPVHYKTPW